MFSSHHSLFVCLDVHHRRHPNKVLLFIADKQRWLAGASCLKIIKTSRLQFWTICCKLRKITLLENMWQINQILPCCCCLSPFKKEWTRIEENVMMHKNISKILEVFSSSFSATPPHFWNAEVTRGKINPGELYAEQKLVNTQSTKSSISTTSKSETCFTRHRGFIFIVCLPGYSRNKIRQPWPSFLLNILVAPIIRLWQLSTNRNPSAIINSTTMNIKRQTFSFKIH